LYKKKVKITLEQAMKVQRGIQIFLNSKFTPVTVKPLDVTTPSLPVIHNIHTNISFSSSAAVWEVTSFRALIHIKFKLDTAAYEAVYRELRTATCLK